MHGLTVDTHSAELDPLINEAPDFVVGMRVAHRLVGENCGHPIMLVSITGIWNPMCARADEDAGLVSRKLRNFRFTTLDFNQNPPRALIMDYDGF